MLILLVCNIIVTNPDHHFRGIYINLHLLIEKISSFERLQNFLIVKISVRLYMRSLVLFLLFLACYRVVIAVFLFVLFFYTFTFYFIFTMKMSCFKDWNSLMVNKVGFNDFKVFDGQENICFQISEIQVTKLYCAIFHWQIDWLISWKIG